MKIILLALTVMIFWISQGQCQDSQQLFDQVTKAYTGSDASENALIGGFSVGGLIGGVLFGSIGFVALIYGKRNAEFKPMLIGLSLMAYPYFIRNTLALYLVGAALTVALFVWRE